MLSLNVRPARWRPVAIGPHSLRKGGERNPSPYPQTEQGRKAAAPPWLHQMESAQGVGKEQGLATRHGDGTNPLIDEVSHCPEKARQLRKWGRPSQQEVPYHPASTSSEVKSETGRAARVRTENILISPLIVKRIVPGKSEGPSSADTARSVRLSLAVPKCPPISNGLL